jgi:hypothetical protein
MSQTLIDYYKAIEDSSLKMLNAAKSEDWEQVVRYEGACAVLIEQLRAKAHSEELLPESCSAFCITTPKSATWPSRGWRTASRRLTDRASCCTEMLSIW